MELLKDFGFAYGNYSILCHKCKSSFVGDKRAIHCKDCAEKLLKVEIEVKNHKPIEPEVGEIFSINSSEIWYKCIEQEDGDCSCNHQNKCCAFVNDSSCEWVVCSSLKRKDKKEVLFNENTKMICLMADHGQIAPTKEDINRVYGGK